VDILFGMGEIFHISEKMLFLEWGVRPTLKSECGHHLFNIEENGDKNKDDEALDRDAAMGGGGRMKYNRLKYRV